MNTQIEICCGSYYDARQAEAGGAVCLLLYLEYLLCGRHYGRYQENTSGDRYLGGRT